MDSIDLLFDKGKLELATFINEPTNKFTKLGNFVYGIVSFHDGKIRVPARLTDQISATATTVDLASLEGTRSDSAVPQTLLCRQKRRRSNHITWRSH